MTTIEPDISSKQGKIAAVARECAALARDYADEQRVEALLDSYFRNVPDAAVTRRSVPELLGLVKNHFQIEHRLPVGQGTVDLEGISEIDYTNPLSFEMYAPADPADPANLRFKVFSAERNVTLTRMMPHLTLMGVEVVEERAYQVEINEHRPMVYDLGLKVRGAEDWTEADRERFMAVFEDSYNGRIEADGLNALALSGLTSRQIVYLRAISRWLQQAGVPYSQESIARALLANPKTTRTIVTAFEANFDPELKSSLADRKVNVEAAYARIEKNLESVDSLDQDRIIRYYITFLRAAVRTNAYQHDSEALAIKIRPREIPFLPEPRPMHEIWVYSPRVEGLHLRYGYVARGGLRWSDRRDDFRTEILGLVKAQMVKNTVIVPVGAKGGFYPKNLPNPAMDRAGWQAEGVACYKIFVATLLTVTDNIVNGEVVGADCVRWDTDDPYLVVAADKGTATFSDIANGISIERGHWLGDAFASGGSIGYDHKAMGITARGAWESVKRHFRELGRDCQTEGFTCVGIGDMAGDVFGNGMLLSEHTQLVAAFNHMHIFLDPHPVVAASFAERKRLFGLPRSSWADYDVSLISAGGGIYGRSLKSVPVSPQVCAVLGLPEGTTAMAPNDLINSILKAPVDLIYNGGIGTYVKSSAETHEQVADKANDSLRVNGNEIRAKVVGEGGNLGCTQLGRIEYAQTGGKINTDFIDNSAGVDTSDHEVNIKILFAQEIAAGSTTMEERNATLPLMTDHVARHVLAHNISQNHALQSEFVTSGEMAAVHEEWLRVLEDTGYMDRKVQFMPSSGDMQRRVADGLGLTNPELCTLLAWTKIKFEDELLATDLPDDPAYADKLTTYFPPLLQQRFAKAMTGHRLHREIVTTVLVNEFVDNAGITSFYRANKVSGKGLADVMRAYFGAKGELGEPGADITPEERVAYTDALEAKMYDLLG